MVRAHPPTPNSAGESLPPDQLPDTLFKFGAAAVSDLPDREALVRRISILRPSARAPVLKFVVHGASQAGRVLSRRSEDLAMYAVIRTGGKQYVVSPGEQLKLERAAHQNGTIEFSDV